MLRILRLELPKGCAGYTVRAPEVKGRTPIARFRECNRVPRVRRGGILRVQPCGGPLKASKTRTERLRNTGQDYGKWLSSHPRAAPGATHSNSGS